MSEKQQPADKIKLTTSQVLADLESGLDRDAIGKKYGLRPFETKRLFEHPKLKGVRVKTAPNFILEDDTEDEEETPTKPAEKAAPESTPTTTAPKAAQAKKTATASTTSEASKQGEAIKEVKTEEDNVEEADDAAKSKKGLW